MKLASLNRQDGNPNITATSHNKSALRLAPIRKRIFKTVRDMFSIIRRILMAACLNTCGVRMAANEAFKALTYAREEYKRFEEKRDPLLLRDVSEKAWLAVILATDLLLMANGMGKPSSYKERKNMLRTLMAEKPRLAELGIDDKFYARAYKLHILGFHEGALDPEDIKEELKKAEEYLKTIESLIK